MNSDNNLNNDKIQPITGDNNDIDNSLNTTSIPTPLQSINMEENVQPTEQIQNPITDATMVQGSATNGNAVQVNTQNAQENVQQTISSPVVPPQEVPIAPVQGTVQLQGAVPNAQAHGITNVPDTTITTPSSTNITMQPNGVMSNEETEQIQSITTGTVNNNNINNAFDQNNINFVSTGKELKKKKNPVVLTAIVLGILIVVFVFGYFIGYPFIMKTFFNKPKEAFTKGINNVTTLANTLVDDTAHDTGTVDIKLTLDTNIEALKQFSGYTYGVKVGVDPYSSSVEMGYSVRNENTKEDFSEYYYLKKDSFYKRYSTYRDLLYVPDMNNGGIESLFNTLIENRNQITKLNNNDVKYIVNKISNSLISSLNEDKLVKEDTSFTVNNKTIKATKHKYVMDSSTLDSTKNKIINDLTNDEQALQILANILDVNKDDVSKTLNDTFDFADDATLTISIITTLNKLNIIGYEFNYNNQAIITYYKDNDNFEINADLNININDNTIDKKINMIGIKKEKVTDVSIKVDDEDKAKLSISSWSDNQKIFDYSIIDQEGKTITGSFNYTKNNSGKDLKSSIELRVKNDDIYLNATLNIDYDWTNEVANINTMAAKRISDYELEQIDIAFLQYLKNTPLGVLFKTIGGDADPSINDYYGDDYNNEESNNDINNELDDVINDDDLVT